MTTNGEAGLKISLRPELASLFSTLARIPIEELPGLMAQLELIRATIALRMSDRIPDEKAHDELLGIRAASERLGCSQAYLYSNSQKFPFTRRLGRRLLFSSLGIDAFIKSRR